MDPMQPAAQPGMMGDEPEAAPEGDEGYAVVICCYSDGSYAVSKHPLPEEAEEQGQPGVSPEQKVGSLGEALKAALDMIKSNPVAGDADSEFSAGFNGGPAESRPLKGAM
jgi:hypothetical protein